MQDDYNSVYGNYDEEQQRQTAREALLAGMDGGAGGSSFTPSGGGAPDPSIATGNGAAPAGTVLQPWLGRTMPGGDEGNDQRFDTPAPPPQAQGGGGGAAPTGGSLTDPNFASQFVAWWGNQPGTNPSVKNDPNYWIGRFTSGAFGNDQQYAIQRMFQPEGPPEGAAPSSAGPAQSAAPTGGGGNYSPASYAAPQAAGSTYQDPMLPYLRTMLQNLIDKNSTPIDENSPNVNPALSSYRSSRARSLAQERNALAERYAADPSGTGTESGAFNAATQGAIEGAGQDTADFTGNLMYSANSQRMNQLQQMLAMATQLGLTDQAQRIQDEMNKLNLGFNYTSLGANLNSQAALAGLNG